MSGGPFRFIEGGRVDDATPGLLIVGAAEVGGASVVGAAVVGSWVGVRVGSEVAEVSPEPGSVVPVSSSPPRKAK